MKISESLQDFLTEFEEISIGYAEITFLRPIEMDEGQVGYSVDDKGKSLVSDKSGYWQSSWVAFGWDEVGDPIIWDYISDNIIWAMHGEGTWQPEIIADSVNAFRTIIDHLKKLSVNRETPSAIEDNPITSEDVSKFMMLVKTVSKKSQIDYWKSLIENCA